MPQPIPSNSIRSLQIGERVQIVPQWQDPGDEEFERFVIEATPDSPRVLIRTLIPGMSIQPTETIEASKLVRVIDFGKLADLSPEVAIREHGEELTSDQRLFFIEKFPFITLDALGNGVNRRKSISALNFIRPSRWTSQPSGSPWGGWMNSRKPIRSQFCFTRRTGLCRRSFGHWLPSIPASASSSSKNIRNPGCGIL